MKKATENQGNARAHTQYFSPKNKVKDLGLQQNFLPHITSFLQETPMKPSQVPNRISHPPARRTLPLQSPELNHRSRPGPPQSHPHARPHPYPHPVRLPVNVGTPMYRPLPPPKDRLGHLQHSAQPQGLICSSQLTLVSPTNIGASYNRPHPSPSGIISHASPHSRKDLSPLHSHIRRDQVTESMVTLCDSGIQNATVQHQESNKVQSNDVRSPIQTIQLHRPPLIPSVTTKTVKDVSSPPQADSVSQSPFNSQWPQRGYQPSMNTQPSDRSSGSSRSMMYSSVAPYQEHHHKQTPSSENLIPVVDLNCTSQKRHRESVDCDVNAKKQCLQSASSGKAQTPKPTVGNSISSSLVPPSRNSLGLELSLKTTDGQLQTDPEPSSTFKTTQLSCASLSPKSCVKRQLSLGAKHAYVNYSQNHVVKLTELRSPSKPDGDMFRKRGEENNRSCKSNTLTLPEVPKKLADSSPHVQLGSHHSSHMQNNTPAPPIRTLSRVPQTEESRKSDNSTPRPTSKSNSNSGSLSCRGVERKKTPRPRRPVASTYDIDELFTPDPMTYVVSSAQKTAKLKLDGGSIKSPSSSSTVVTSTAPVTESLCHKAQNSTGTGSPPAENTTIPTSSGDNPHIFMPSVSLERVNLENLMYFSSKDTVHRSSPITSSDSHLKNKSVKTDEKHKSLLPNNVMPCALKTDTAASEQTSMSHFPSVLLERQASEGDKNPVYEEDPIDVELDLGLSFALDLDLTQSSHSSEEEQLLSLQEMMARVTKPPNTPEKGAFSEPSTPVDRSCLSKTLPLPSYTKSGVYKNNLDQMLKEINNNKKAKEVEEQLLSACKEDLLRIAEYEEAEENREEGISMEQQEFLQRYSLMSSAIKEVPPGEVVFNLEKFGQIFNQDTLELRRCMVNPQGTAQKTLLWSSPAQLRLHINIGLFQEAYDCHSPCPTQVTRFLFKMMSVHTERMMSEKILQILCDIACTAAYQIVKNGSQLFKVWVPGLADVTLVLMNMGVAFVTLFPFEDLQPPFTEGDLLEDVYINSGSPSSNKEQDVFPDHNCNNILKYLCYCMCLCPRAYSDDELLLLLTVASRIGLDSQLILQSSMELHPLQYKIVNNIRDWDTMLPRICVALSDLTDDHHNMCLLVQLLPDNTRGKQLRRHLSLSMISKLLDGTSYRPTEKEFQLSELRPYLHRMQPSTLLRGMLNSSNRSQKEKDEKEDMAILDQQAYYLCYSLLTLANEASNFQFFPSQQKEQLLFLCSELETHVKCDIRESEKCLYRSKVKDLVARIYTKWQMLLQRTRPLHGKLYDYWEPLPVDTLTSSQEEEQMDSDDGDVIVIGENPAMENDEEEETGVEEDGVVIFAEEQEAEDDTIDYTNKTRNDTTQDERLEEMDGDNITNDTNETDKAIEPVTEALNQEIPEMESRAMNKQIAADNMEHTEGETEGQVA